MVRVRVRVWQNVFLERERVYPCRTYVVVHRASYVNTSKYKCLFYESNGQ